MKNEKYSHKSFNNKTFIDEIPEDFNGEIYGSCFYQESKPNSIIFPEGINCKFISCNLDNVLIPENCILENCTNKQIMIQNDLSDWILDENLNPIEPIDKKLRENFGISINPQDIPLEKQTKNVFDKFKENL